MLPAINRGAGANIGVPDVCMLPPLGTPGVFVNEGMHAMALAFSPNVMLTGMSALSAIAVLPMTMGDEPGVMGPSIKGPGRFVMGNPVVSINMMPGICLCCPTTGNNCNDALGAVLVPSATNVFYTYRELSADDLGALARELASAGREGGPPVEARMLAPGVGGIAIRVFSTDVPARVFCAVQELEAQGMRELLIDLRDNPGGEARAFVELAGDFLPSGSVVATMVDGEGDETVLRSWQEAPYRMPVTILVNRGTASAAELFAECLAAHGRARVEGGPTYGKRVGMEVVVGPDGRATAVTTVRFVPGARG